MNSRDIAILIPCFNAQEYLPQLFETIRAQTVPFAEVWCYDDASEDETAAVAEKLGASTIRRTENRGAAYGRNRLLEATSCRWVHFHDADDLLDPRFVEVMSERLTAARHCVLCSMDVVERESRKLRDTVSYGGLDASDDPVDYFLNNMGFAIVGVYPTEALRAIGGFREDLRGNEDPDLHIRLAIAGENFAVEQQALVTNLIRRDSFSEQNRQRCQQDELKCLIDYCGKLDDRYNALLGRRLLSVAWRLYASGDTGKARSAIRHARECGARHLPSHRFATRLLSQCVGFEPVFALKAFSQFLRQRLEIQKA